MGSSGPSLALTGRQHLSLSLSFFISFFLSLCAGALNATSNLSHWEVISWFFIPCVLVKVIRGYLGFTMDRILMIWKYLV